MHSTTHQFSNDELFENSNLNRSRCFEQSTQSTSQVEDEEALCTGFCASGKGVLGLFISVTWNLLPQRVLSLHATAEESVLSEFVQGDTSGSQVTGKQHSASDALLL